MKRGHERAREGMRGREEGMRGQKAMRRGDESLDKLGMLDFSTKSVIWEKLAKAEEGNMRRLRAI